MEKTPIEKLIEAAEHALAVFRSLGERGYYPQELLPCDGEGKESPLFMGKQGMMFLITAIKEAKESINSWIEWKGGPPPVARHVEVEYIMRDHLGETDISKACDLDWSHGNPRLFTGAEIVAYRVVDKNAGARAKDDIRSWLMPMSTSAGMEYYVAVGWPENYMTPQMYKIKGRAEFDVAEWNHMFGHCAEPNLFDYDTEGESDAS